MTPIISIHLLLSETPIKGILLAGLRD